MVMVMPSPALAAVWMERWGGVLRFGNGIAYVIAIAITIAITIKAAAARN
jgi:hypothetical protein